VQRERADLLDQDPDKSPKAIEFVDCNDPAALLLPASRLTAILPFRLRTVARTRQAVSHLKFSYDMSWSSWLVLKLLSEVGHIDTKVVGTIDVARAPNFQEKLTMSQYLAVAACERR
jgi:hypothetical protein